MKKINDMKWNLDDVKGIVSNVEKITGEDLSYLEINYNPRLKTTLAWCKNHVVYENTYKNGKTRKTVAWIKPYCLEFGKVILSVEKYETFEQTVLHEIAHAIANKKYNDDCGHDERFKEVCEEIGCYESGATTNESDIMETHEKIKSSSKSNSTNTKGYRVVCKGCGEKLSHYKTKCQTVKNIENPTNSRYTYMCPLCGSRHLGIERE